MQKISSVQVVISSPEKEYEKKKLSQRIASAYAEYVLSEINQLSCSAKQKSDLLRAVIEMAKNQKSL